MINSLPETQQNPQNLPDDTDRVSSLVGFNVNNYINNSNDTFSLQNKEQNVQNPTNLPNETVQNENTTQKENKVKENKKKKGLGKLLDSLGIMALLVSCGLIIKRNAKIPKLDSIKNFFSKITPKFKK